MLHTENTTGFGSADLATVQVDHLSGAAGGNQVITDLVQPAETQAGLFLPFPLRHVFRAFAIFVHSSYELQQPGGLVAAEGTETELFQEHDFIPLRVVGEHAGGVAADEEFAGERGHVAAVKARVGQPEFVHAEEALENGFAFFDFDVAGVELERFRHSGFRFGVRLGTIAFGVAWVQVSYGWCNGLALTLACSGWCLAVVEYCFPKHAPSARPCDA